MWFWLEPQLLHIQRRDALLIPYTCLFPKALLETYAFKCDSHGLPSCKACIMTIQEQYWCAVVSQTFSLFPSLWFRSSRPRTPEGRARYSLLLLVKLFLFVYLPVLVFFCFLSGLQFCVVCICCLSTCITVLLCFHWFCKEQWANICLCLCVWDGTRCTSTWNTCHFNFFFFFCLAHICHSASASVCHHPCSTKVYVCYVTGNRSLLLICSNLLWHAIVPTPQLKGPSCFRNISERAWWGGRKKKTINKKKTSQRFTTKDGRRGRNYE